MFRLYFLLLTICCSSCAELYIRRSPSYQQAISQQKRIACIPFNVQTITQKIPKNMTWEMIKEEDKEMGYFFRQGSYAYLLSHHGKKKKAVAIQPLALTDSLLQEAGIHYETMASYTPQELAKILGVDAVITGDIYLNRVMSVGGATMIAVVTAVVLPVGIFISPNTAQVELKVFDSQHEEEIWRWKVPAHQVYRSLFRNRQKMFMEFMNVPLKKMPYQAESVNGSSL